MSLLAVRLDPNVEVVHDDRGRIVLLPHDTRNPIRLSPSDEPLLKHLRSGVCDMEGRGVDAPLTENQRGRFNAIAVALDRAGLLMGRRVAPESRTIRFRSLARQFDRLAGALTRPLNALSVPARGHLLQAFTAATILTLVALWWSMQGRMFAAAITPYWLLAMVLFAVAFPVVHEFSHALTGRLFGLEVTMVGAQHRGGLSWTPFVEVRRAVLSSDPTVRIWIPLAGVVCNLFLALLSGLWLRSVAPGSVAAGIAGMLTVLLHLRVLLDGGFGLKSDASQALQVAGELLPPAEHARLTRLVRGGYVLFLICFVCMVALSFKDSGMHP